MAANRDIVFTRKLNKNNKARLGRGGDTKIREVDGKDSHVNALEAYLIDVNRKAGEEYTKRVGSGTTNPLTGMPEYHDMVQEHYHTFWGESGDAGVIYVKDGETSSTPGLDPAEEFDREEYMAATDKDAYLYKIGIPKNKLEFFKANYNKAYLGEGGFLSQAQDITEAGATLAETTAGLQYGPEGEAYKGADIAFDIGQSGVKETRRAAGAQYGLGMEQAGITAGRSLYAAKEAGDVAAARSGFATPGTITGTTGRAQKGVFQDYTMQQKSLAEARGSAMTRADITMAGVTEAQRSTKARADISYGGVRGFGIKGQPGYVAGSAGITRTGAQLDYETGVSDIGQTAEEEFWRNLEAAEV